MLSLSFGASMWCFGFLIVKISCLLVASYFADLIVIVFLPPDLEMLLFSCCSVSCIGGLFYLFCLSVEFLGEIDLSCVDCSFDRLCYGSNRAFVFLNSRNSLYLFCCWFSFEEYWFLLSIRKFLFWLALSPWCLQKHWGEDQHEL